MEKSNIEVLLEAVNELLIYAELPGTVENKQKKIIRERLERAVSLREYEEKKKEREDHMFDHHRP